MTTTPAPSARKMFVTLPVSDLARTKALFAGLGFTFNAQFTDEKAACLVISEDSFAMLLATSYFKTFTTRPLCPPGHTEMAVGFSCESRAEVDRLLAAAVAGGGTDAKQPQDHGFMYSQTFYDLDGHHWEAVWMDATAVQK